MRRILAVSVALLVPAVAYAQTLDPPISGPPPPITRVAEAKQVRVLPPLKLPNIPLEVRRLQAADRSVAQKQLVASQRVLRFWAGQHAWLLAKRHQKCSEVPWQRSCTVARASVRLHTALSDAAEHKLVYEIPMTTNWTRAMRYAQRVFPGTYDWLAFISNRECRSCYTTSAFICNYQGSGACGPMQFMSGTFYGYANDARAYLTSHGFTVDPAAWSWRSQLGQALTAAFMRFTHREGCHWCLT